MIVQFWKRDTFGVAIKLFVFLFVRCHLMHLTRKDRPIKMQHCGSGRV